MCSSDLTAKSVEDGSYAPLSRPIFVYVSARSLERSEVREFAEYYLRNAPKLVREVKYVPLPANAYALTLEHLTKRKLGTVFGGTPEVGLRIEELLRREAKF